MKAKIYLHSSKEDMVCQAEEAGITSKKALEKLAYALYEVEFELEIDPKTGEYKILSVKEV
jgi:hypothetical protein